MSSIMPCRKGLMGLSDMLGEPGGLVGDKDKAVLDRRPLGVQPGDIEKRVAQATFG